MAEFLYNNRPWPELWEEDAQDIAKVLCNAGYRKASDVAREAIDELERRLYSVSHRETSITGYFYSVVDIDEIAYEAEELKKKYESEGEG
jgi:hypothetical protein